MGTVVKTGPAGVVGDAVTTIIPYTPSGYNPTYAAWEVRTADNTAEATLTPAAGSALDQPVFLVDAYTSADVPAVSINGATAPASS